MNVNKKNKSPVSHIQTYTGCFFKEPIVLTKFIINKSQPAINGNENQGLNSQYSLPPKTPKMYEIRMAIIVVIKRINCTFTSAGKRRWFLVCSCK
jgi:hypothetical protein